jgi:hypothetical protein
MMAALKEDLPEFFREFFVPGILANCVLLPRGHLLHFLRQFEDSGGSLRHACSGSDQSGSA